MAPIFNKDSFAHEVIRVTFNAVSIADGNTTWSTPTAHGFSVGSTVTINGNAAGNGLQTVAAVPTATSFTVNDLTGTNTDGAATETVIPITNSSKYTSFIIQTSDFAGTVNLNIEASAEHAGTFVSLAGDGDSNSRWGVPAGGLIEGNALVAISLPCGLSGGLRLVITGSLADQTGSIVVKMTDSVFSGPRYVKT